MAVVVMLGLGALVGGFLGVTSHPMSVPPQTTVATKVPEAIHVHVAGWVVAPGVVEVSDGAIVAEALAAAGGARLGARVDQINLASTLREGDQVFVPGPGETSESDGAGQVSLNRAEASDLESVPGVGPVLAARIVTFREKNGDFVQLEDLLQVSGIGEAKLAAMRDYLKVP